MATQHIWHALAEEHRVALRAAAEESHVTLPTLTLQILQAYAAARIAETLPPQPLCAEACHKHNKLTPEQRAAVLEMYPEIGVVQLAQRFQVGRSTIRRVLA